MKASILVVLSHRAWYCSCHADLECLAPHRWVPKGNLTSSLSVAFSGGPVGIIAALLLAPVVIDTLGWPSVFYICGATGLAWAAYWQPTIPEQPPRAPLAAASAGGRQWQYGERNAALQTSCRQTQLPPSPRCCHALSVRLEPRFSAVTASTASSSCC